MYGLLFYNTFIQNNFMFSLFGKKEFKTKIIDRVFISENAKNNALLTLAREDESPLFVTWFQESYDQLTGLLKSNNLNSEVFLARQMASHHAQDGAVIFFEHYPIATTEDELLMRIQVHKAVFYSSLDEPLFKQFGGDRIVEMMHKMGIQENEAIEHSLISNAIRNAQEKINEQIVVEQQAASQMDWFSKNLVK